MIAVPYKITPEIEQIISVHHQLWDQHPTVTYKDQTQTAYVPQHNGYRSAIFTSTSGIPHLWITQNMTKTTYGTYAITRAREAGQRLRITWIVHTANDTYRYAGQIQTHEYFHPHTRDRIHIETYDGDNVHVVYTNNPAYGKVSSSL
jgi:hypothetical protein